MTRRLKLVAGCAMLAVAACSGPQNSEDASHIAAHGQDADPASDKVAYLSQLMLMRGHLHSGASLYAAGDVEGATVHMKHPEDELYADLLPAFAAWNASGFATQLQALAASVENGGAVAQVDAGLAAVNAAIDAAADAAAPTPKDLLLASAQALQVAGEEFDMAVRDGKIVNAREYQDAHGFMTTALAWIERTETSDPAVREALDAARGQVVLALAVAPDVVPPEIVTTQSATILEAAAAIEQAAATLR